MRVNPIRTVAVFTGSSRGHDPAYAGAAAELGTRLAGEGIGLVYGGGDVGLMGVVADAAMRAGGEVVGVIPQSLVEGEIAHHGITRLEVVDTMHVRKQRMAELADAFTALPGGVGTLEEFFEVWTWQQLGLHTKPVALYNTRGFWDGLLAAVDTMVDAGFLSSDRRDSLIVADEPDALLDALRSWSPPTPKWKN